MIVSASTLSGVVNGWLGGANAFVLRTRQAIADGLVGPDFAGAAFGLERYRSVAGTYEGAAIAVDGVRVAWARSDGYCVEGRNTAGELLHLAGPHGRVATGGC